MTNFNLVKNQKYFLSFSGVLIVSGLLAVLIWGLKPGLDFTGGSLLEVSFSEARPDNQAVEQKISSLVEKPVLSKPPAIMSQFVWDMKMDESLILLFSERISTKHVLLRHETWQKGFLERIAGHGISNLGRELK